MEHEEFVQAVRHHFAYLWQRYGFDMVHFAPSPRGSEYTFVGLESKTCRIAVEQERGAVTALIGPRTSAFGSDVTIQGVPQWYNIERVVDFVRQQPFRWLPYDQSVRPDQELAYLAGHLEPVVAEIIEMFRTPEAVAQWAPQYEAYGDAQVQLRFG